ncbi:C2 and GRAM domain-containing protein At5g50170 isoform X1 [Quercus lobata]|uniref:C2 and GRAM domain-containing protein At5g50170 isoform X1 n=1 Tax=Quercus lobata TaxID=97700 RepID=UPI0012451A64|nr:C2 and GRAM domain-containing protein At5g50170 isoform X1 [Quercus lobata]
MRLYVYVLEAKDLSVKDSYVKLQVEKHKSKTRILRNTMMPVWNEEFVFRVHDMDEELVVSLFHHDDEPRVLHGSRDLVGRVRIPVWSIAAEENHTLLPTWFPLERPKAGKFINEDYGKILLTISLHGKGHDSLTKQPHYVHSNVKIEEPKELEGPHISSQDIVGSKAPRRKMAEGKILMKAVASRLERLFNKNEEAPRNGDSMETSSTLSDYEDCMEEHPSTFSFEEGIDTMQSRNNGQEMPENLQGGILLDQIYAVPPYDLNAFLFVPDSQFRKELAELQGTIDVQEGCWIWKSGETSCLTRNVSYIKAASKLVKAVKATEEQTYIRAGGGEFAVLVSVSTPEVPYGNTFKVELLYKIMSGPALSSGEESSHLVLSWGINFLQNTMMRGMIEGGVRQGLKESFEQFANLLAQNFKTLDSMNLSNKDDVLATLQTEHQSDWNLTTEYFWNFTVVATIVMVLYVLVHILLSEPRKMQGLEFNGIDLPDNIEELITCGFLFIQLERVYNMISRFIQARFQRGSDHGVKSQGDGWVLTIALIEGINLASLESTEFCNPYVVFTCNGKTRTSSVQLQPRESQWNEILEFDAMEEPPSVLDVEVFDFDCPFDQTPSLGHAEINFVKHTSTELADMWVPLEGKFAQSSQSKLHLRIFLDNNNGVETIREYLTKMEKEVGKKLNLRSPHKNSTFQKLFGLPPEEFLISDYACSLKRKMHLQGKLFLSARIVGFYANLFGHKTSFFFLWEDIEAIQVLPPTLASVGSPTLVLVLRKGRGLDARHGAKSQDEEGRLKFYFQSFVSFNVASRTIMALWRTRTLSPEQKEQIAKVQEDQDERSVTLEDAGSILDAEDASRIDAGSSMEAEDANISKFYNAELPVDIKSLMEMFDGGKLEHKIMGKSGCLNYTTTTWDPVKPDVYERHLSYKFNRHVSTFGGDVTCTQQKFPIAKNEGWIVNEVMALHGVPFGDHFRVHFRYQIEKSPLAHCACKCDVYMGITWLKSTKFQERITRNITEKFTNRLKEIFELAEIEILFTNSSG